MDSSSFRSLVHLLNGDTIAEAERLNPREWVAVVGLAGRHRVSGLLPHALRSHGLDARLPADSRESLEARERRAAISILHLQSAAAELRDAYAHHAIDVLALKGLHLSATVYPALTARPMADIDVLVCPERALDARAIAVSLGYRLPRGDDPQLDLAAKHHFDTLVRGAASLEIHWCLTPPARSRPIPDARTLLARAVPFPLGAQDMLGLCPADLLLHLCSHASYQHLFEQRLGALWDIALVISAHRDLMDWASVVRNAEQWGVTGGTRLTLQLCAELTGADIPASALDGLAPAPPAHVLHAAMVQISRAPSDVLISHHVTRLLDPSIPPARRLRALVSRLFLVGTVVEQRVSGHWRQRAARALRLITTYSRKFSSGRSHIRELALQRNALSAWLDPGLDAGSRSAHRDDGPGV